MDPQIAAFKLEGLCAAHFQPFDPKTGDVDNASIALHVAELRRQGVSSVFTTGTTAEGVKLSVAERKSVLEAWVAAARASEPPLTVIAHVGAESVRDAMDLAAHAQAVGAAAAGLVAPSYFKPGDIAACVALLEAVAAKCDKLPLYWYSIPSMSGVAVRSDLLLKRVAQLQDSEARLRSVRGVKFSEPDLHIFSNCINVAGGRFDCLYGKDEQGLGALAMGARGFIGSTYNYVGRAANAMIAAFRAGDMAGALAAQRKVMAVVDLLYQSGEYGPAGCNVGKAIMELRLGGAGCGPARLPGYSVSDEGRAKLKADLERIGFFEM
jgi:N-acetylneuraminate lyase